MHTIGADGSGDRLIAAGGYATASWSPEGTRIVAAGAPPPPPPFTPVTGPIVYRRLVLLAADGSSQSPIPNTDNAGGGVWSPDGSRIAFGRDATTWVIAPDGSGLRSLGVRGLPGTGAWSAGPRLTRPVRMLPALPTVLVTPASGQVKVKSSGAAGFRAMQFVGYYRAGTRIDARRGRARLSRVRDDGRFVHATLRDGIFELARVSRRRVDVRLIGRRRCGGSLHLDAGFALRVHGRRSTTAGRNAAWSVADRCNGSTVTTVHRGHVSVRDLRRKRTRTLRAGARYTAR